MPRGGYRPGAGRPKGASTGVGPAAAATTVAEVTVEAAKKLMSPLDYMLKVINDPHADSDRRDRIAIAAAPFCHARKEAVGAGKKEERATVARETAETSKFSASRPPRLIVNN